MIVQLAEQRGEADTLAVLNLLKSYKITQASAWEALWKVAKPEHLQQLWEAFSTIELDATSDIVPCLTAACNAMVHASQLSLIAQSLDFWIPLLTSWNHCP